MNKPRRLLLRKDHPHRDAWLFVLGAGVWLLYEGSTLLADTLMNDGHLSVLRWAETLPTFVLVFMAPQVIIGCWMSKPEELNKSTERERVIIDGGFLACLLVQVPLLFGLIRQGAFRGPFATSIVLYGLGFWLVWRKYKTVPNGCLGEEDPHG